MFGWEYPPHITGGLGTACYALTKELTSLEDVQISFVVPKAHGDEIRGAVKIIGASNVNLSAKAIRLLKRMRLSVNPHFHPKLTAYTSPNQYQEFSIHHSTCDKPADKTHKTGKIDLSGGYGDSIFDEIEKYSIVAGEIASQEPFDIIHAHDWLTFKAGIAAKKETGKPLVIHVHATEYDRSGDNHNKNVFRVEQSGMKEADAIIAVSDLTRNIIIDKYHIPPSKVITIHNAVESVNTGKIDNPWRIGTKDKIVTFLGRITHQKGPEFFIEAAGMVLKRMENVRFVMAGMGDLMPRMISLVAQRGLSCKFHFTGFLRGNDVYRMLCASDLFVMPSVSEPFGIAPLEAIQSSVPVIISKQSGVSEVLKNAIKVDFWDIHAMADAIYAVLNYEALRDTLIKNGKPEVENMKWANAAYKIRELYYRLIYSKAG